MKIDFWQNETERLTRAILDRAFGDAESVTLSTILGTPFPELFTASLSKYARKILVEEKPFEVRSLERYSMESAAIQAQIDKLNATFISETRLRKEEVVLIAEDAIAFEIDVIVGPRQKALDLVSRNEEILKTDIEMILKGFGETRGYIDRLIKALSGFRGPSMSVAELDRLLKRGEKETYAEKPLSTLLQEVGLYRRFQSLAVGEESTTVHSEVLLTIIQNRGLTAMLEEIGEEARTKEMWSLPEITNSLQRFILVGSLDETSTAEELADTNARLTKTAGITNPKEDDLETLLFDFLEDNETPEKREA